MTNLDILETKREFNKWLKELTESENLLLMEMMDEAREMGYNDATIEACQEIAKNYHPNDH